MSRDIDYDAETLKVTTDGSGDGTATSVAGYHGVLHGFYLNFAATAAAGTDTLIQAITPQGNTINLLSLTDVNTDGYYPVLMEAYSPAGAALGVYVPFELTGDQIKVTVAQGGATVTNCVQATPKIT